MSAAARNKTRSRIPIKKKEMVNWKLKKSEDDKEEANLRPEFEGELPSCPTTNVEGSPKKKPGPLTAGETKTSVLRQELNSGKGGKSKWSWKEREDDMRELERKNLEQKREIQKLKKFQDSAKGELESTKEELETARKELDTAKDELSGVQEKLVVEKTNSIEEIVRLGEYLDTEGKKYVILHDQVAQEREEQIKELQQQLQQLQTDNYNAHESLANTQQQHTELNEQIKSLTTDKAQLDSSIELLLKEKEQIELERDSETRTLKMEFEAFAKDIEGKLEEKEKERFTMEAEKEELLQELSVFVEAKKQLEVEIDNMSGVIQEQVGKIDELSVKIFGRDEDLRNKLDEVEKVREECLFLQDTTNTVSTEQQNFINTMWTKLGEMTKTLKDVEYSKQLNIDPEEDDSLDLSREAEREAEALLEQQRHKNNEDDLKEELNSSFDLLNESMDQVHTRTNSEVMTKFEEVRNLLVQKLAHVDTVVGNREYQINKCVYQTSEWKTNSRKLEEEVKLLKETFEGLIELKEKENHDVREQMQTIQSEYNARVSELEKIHQIRIEELESSCAYYRDQVESLTNELQKKSKDFDSNRSEQSEMIETMREELALTRGEVESRERELSEMSRKYELSISQVEEREQVVREEHERYLSEEIDRIQQDCKNKLKHVEEEQQTTEAKLIQEYETKLAEMEKEMEKVKVDNVDILHNSQNAEEMEEMMHTALNVDMLHSTPNPPVDFGDASTQCERGSAKMEDKASMTMENLSFDDTDGLDDELLRLRELSFEREELEDELLKVRDAFTLKSREYELLQAKYDAQYRLVDFVTLSLEQERAKKNNANDEILNILEKLEQKVSETLHHPITTNGSTNELYASENSINSMLTESLPESIYTNGTNPPELNTTWPPKLNKREETSPIRRWSSLGIIEQDQEKRKELIERLRTEISAQLNGISPLRRYSSRHHKTPHLNLPKPWSSIMDDGEGRGRLPSTDRNNGLLSVKSSYGKSGSLRSLLKHNEASHDSGLDNNDDHINELISFPNQLHNVIEMFKRLDEQHEQLKEDNNNHHNNNNNNNNHNNNNHTSLDLQWSMELDSWKNRVQYKINDLKPLKHTPSDRSDSALSTISNSSILFHPDDNEVKAIIANANKMYDSAHFVL